ncbi:hypothetical protein ACRRTK_022897 [Alexandromys fortis]
MTGVIPEADRPTRSGLFSPLRCDAQIKCALDCVRISIGLKVVVLLLYGHSYKVTKVESTSEAFQVSADVWQITCLLKTSV